MSATHATFTIERHYGHTRAQVFSAWSRPELKRVWFFNPGDWDDAEWEIDFRVGGTELHRGGASTGFERAFLARYHEIVEDERIVFAYDLHHAGRLVSVSLTTIELADDADRGTRMTFTEQGVYLVADTGVAEREHGTGKMLDKLGRALAGEPVR